MDEHEIVRLQMIVAAQQKEIDNLGEGYKDLSTRVDSVTATMRMGKGMLFGIVFVLGSAGIAIGQSLKRLLNI